MRPDWQPCQDVDSDRGTAQSSIYEVRASPARRGVVMNGLDYSSDNKFDAEHSGW